jgi:sensor domain CHASE-containing protein
MELQFSRAVSAAEVLGVLARQGGGAIPSFTKVAAELLAARPGVLSLELQPGGIVSDIVPRLGNERAIGFNVLKDPAQRAGANTAIQSRVLTVAGPLTLYHGEPGLVARVPVFQQGRDGRDYFWGFVAVSMRFSDALARAGLDEVSTRGYNYALFAPGVAGQKAVTIAGRGGLPPQDAVQQPIRAQNIEFRLALWPRGGWVSTTKALVESLGVLLLSGLLGLLAYLVGTQRQMEASLSDLDHRLTRETADRKKAQEDLGRAKDAAAAVQADLKQTQAAVQRAESAIAEAQARVETATHAEKETAAAAEVQLRQDQTTIAELRSSLESALRSARQDAEACAANRQIGRAHV